MGKMWAGRTDGATSKIADDFNASISFDKRLYREDITGSLAHASMLLKQGIITADEYGDICSGLKTILAGIEDGTVEIDETCEDIHMFVEGLLTSMKGQAGKKLHTARSRNDQVALDMRLYMIRALNETKDNIKALIDSILHTADTYKNAIMPGYTHMQRAQPVTFGHHMMAYAMMLLRDLGRMSDCLKRTAVSPIGACALAGTTYNTDRRYEASLLGMDEICMNSMDAVSDRDFCVEFLSAGAVCMMHLSRLSEELVLWSGWEFKFIELSDELTTGSSIMPQKKNPDMAELVRGKTGRVYGDLMALLTTLKGTPLAYNKDMQEDKESVFDALDTVNNCLILTAAMISSVKVNTDRLRRAAGEGFINATDLADYLVGKGMAFRDAYKISGKIVSECILRGETLETLPLDIYASFSPLFDSGVYEAVNLDNCLAKRTSEGGPTAESVEKQIEFVRSKEAEF